MRTRSYVVYTPAGFLAGWDSAKGQPTYTACLDDAALFALAQAHKAGLSENGAVLTMDGCLLTMDERQGK